jgi:hypothetical protein
MDEGRLLVWLIVQTVKLIYLIVRGVLRAFASIVRGVARRLRGAPVPEATSPAPAKLATQARAPAAAEDPAVARLTLAVRELATRGRALEARCAAAPLCAPLLRTLHDVVLPRLDAALVDLRRATGATDLAPLESSAAYLDALTQLLSRMADQRSDDALDELIDDADTLAEACYRPVVDYCRTNAVPLSSDRVATVFGDDCSPWLGRLDDPTGLAILHLPWKWLAEVHRWPAIGHEVGHDFYDSVAGLDAEVLARHGLASEIGRTGVLDGSEGVALRDVDRIVANWRRELVADAFGVMMLGPAYVVTTAAIFARPDQPLETLAVQVDEGGTRYEVHPPGHIRVAAVCRLLARMGHGALGVTLEQKWRAQHGEPVGILLPVPEGWLRIPDEPFLDRAVALTSSLYQEGFSALRGIPLASMPGFDFGPREHEAALRARDAFLAAARMPVTDARLLIAGAVLAWAERPHDGARLLRAARSGRGRRVAPRKLDAGAPARRLPARPAARATRVSPPAGRSGREEVSGVGRQDGAREVLHADAAPVTGDHRRLQVAGPAVAAVNQPEA